MCIVIVAYRVVGRCPVVLGANRDEALARGGEAPRLLRHGPAAWGGRDPVAGGTWLAVNERGLVVALTDRPAAAPDPARRSRGLLCLDALGCGAAGEVAQWLRGELAARPYNPFDLLWADCEASGVACYDGRLRLAPLERGVHVLTGGELDDVAEPKIARAFELLAGLPLDGPGAVERLKAILGDRRPGVAEDDQICMLGERHGTLSSSVLTVGDEPFPRGSCYWHAAGPPCRTPYEDVSGLTRPTGGL